MASKKRHGRGGRDVAAEYKLLVVQERMRGTPGDEVARAFGVSAAAVQKWTHAFRTLGTSGLESKRGATRAKRATNPIIREQVLVDALSAPPFLDEVDDLHEGHALVGGEVEVAGSVVVVAPLADEPDAIAAAGLASVVGGGDDAYKGEARAKRPAGAFAPGVAAEFVVGGEVRGEIARR